MLFVGRMVDKKAPDVLLRAVKRLVEMDEGDESSVRIEAAFVGGVLIQASVEDAARSISGATIRCRGPMRHEDVLGLCDAYDVFCPPSYSEGLPVVLREATASGIAVVTTPVPAIRELVRAGVSGLLVSPGDVGRTRPRSVGWPRIQVCGRRWPGMAHKPSA